MNWSSSQAYKEEDITDFVGFILNQIRNILRSCPLYSIQFVRRQANLVAHSLARNSFLFEQDQIFLNILHCIADILSIKKYLIVLQ